MTHGEGELPRRLRLQPVEGVVKHDTGALKAERQFETGFLAALQNESVSNSVSSEHALEYCTREEQQEARTDSVRAGRSQTGTEFRAAHPRLASALLGVWKPGCDTIASSSGRVSEASSKRFKSR